MKTEIVPFQFGSREIRVIRDENEEPWWVAKEICDALGLENVTRACARLDEDEKNTITLSKCIPGNPETVIVNEPGMYSLVLRSEKPEAKAFKRWVTHEVLPAIRKTGTSYSIPEGMTLISKYMLPASQLIQVCRDWIGKQTQPFTVIEMARAMNREEYPISTNHCQTAIRIERQQRLLIELRVFRYGRRTPAYIPISSSFCLRY